MKKAYCHLIIGPFPKETQFKEHKLCTSPYPPFQFHEEFGGSVVQTTVSEPRAKILVHTETSYLLISVKVVGSHGI